MTFVSKTKFNSLISSFNNLVYDLKCELSIVI